MWQEFENPSAEWRGKPFWSWNGELKKEELIRQVHIMKEMGFGGFFMHSRSGLATEYLGEEWFELINACADEAEKLGMEAWLYDEDRWPSGSAGGKVTEDRQYRMKAVWLNESDTLLPKEKCIARFAVTLKEGKLVSYRKAEGALRQDERAACFTVEDMECSSNYNGYTYIDTMSRAATERFIELTHEEYVRHCGSRLGKSIKGIFTDEPHRGNALSNRKEENGIVRCSTPWTEKLPEEFEKRKGYDLITRLPELFYSAIDSDENDLTRDYFDVTDQLFLENFAEPINDWCEKHGLIFTGHVLHEDSLTAQAVPQGSLMRFYQHMGIPGIDLLGPDNECYWVATQLSSACRQLGKKRLLSELYGASGWDFDLNGHKAVGDWQALEGINLRCPHLSWYTMEGEAKRDYPASILHQSPWYPDYRQVEDYFARFGYMMAQGTPDCDVLVVSPIESVWSLAYAGWANWIIPNDEHVKELENTYAETFHALADRGIDFDYGEEEMMAGLGKDDGEGIRIGQMKYRIAVVSGMLQMRVSTAVLLEKLMNNGGKVVFCGSVPKNAESIASHKNALHCEVSELGELVETLTNEKAKLAYVFGKPIFMKARNMEDGSLLVTVLNSDREHPASAVELMVKGDYAHVLKLDLETGTRMKTSFNRENGCCVFSMNLDSGESRMLLLTNNAEEAEPESRPVRVIKSREIEGELDYKLSEENVCVLDRCDWRWENGKWHGMNDVLRSDSQIRDEAGIEHRGGEMLQPWFAKKFDDPSFGSIELRYEFDIEELPEAMTLAAERPDRCRYFINGTELSCPNENDFWIDICFKRFPIRRSLLKKGRNEITVKTVFTRTSNIEAVYLLGPFSVRLSGVQAAIGKLPEKLKLGDIKPQGLPFYTGPLTLYVPVSGNADKVTLSPKGFTGAAIRIRDGLDEEVTLKWAPWEADITKAAQNGGTVRVTLVPTRRNTFGPLHVKPVRFGPCGPQHFTLTDEMWTDEYSLLENGIEKLILIEYGEDHRE